MWTVAIIFFSLCLSIPVYGAAYLNPFSLLAVFFLSLGTFSAFYIQTSRVVLFSLIGVACFALACVTEPQTVLKVTLLYKIVTPGDMNLTTQSESLFAIYRNWDGIGVVLRILLPMVLAPFALLSWFVNNLGILIANISENN